MMHCGEIHSFTKVINKKNKRIGPIDPWGTPILIRGPSFVESLVLLPKLQQKSAAVAVLQYTAELITGFSPLMNISAVITTGIFKRVKTNSSLT